MDQIPNTATRVFSKNLADGRYPKNKFKYILQNGVPQDDSTILESTFNVTYNTGITLTDDETTIANG